MKAWKAKGRYRRMESGNLQLNQSDVQKQAKELFIKSVANAICKVKADTKD